MRRWGLVLAAVAAIASALATTALGSHQVPGCTSTAARLGELRSPILDLSNISAPTIQFETWWEIEAAGPVEHDLLKVQFSTDGGITWQDGAPATLNAAAGLVNGGAQGAPVSDQGVQTRPAFGPESEFVSIGQAGLQPDARIRFVFDTVDVLQNGFRGWAIDDVAIFDGSLTNPIVGGDFEGTPAGWTMTGFWHVVDDAQALGLSAEAASLVSLGPADDGTLPADPDGARFAWFGEDSTGTYCGADALHGPPAQQPPGQQPQQPGQQQPQQEQPQQQEQQRDRFPADIPTATTLDALPDPGSFRSFNVGTDAGLVFVRLRGGRGGARASQAGAPPGFIRLTQAAQLPLGSIVEASRGRVTLESTADARGLRTQRSGFFGGRFQVAQPRSARPITEMILKGGSFRGCPRAGKAGAGPRADASQSRRRGRRVRRVWGDGRGNFRTRGRYSSAAVRGTTWLTEDYCNGTLTRVARRPRTNRVAVRDFIRRRSVTLRAGQSYFAFKR